MYTKQFVILAKSYKEGGWCIAGREVQLNESKTTYSINDAWIRPVSDDLSHHGAISNDHCRYEDGKLPAVYDIVEVDFIGVQQEPGQPENELIANTFWRKLESIEPNGINSFEGNVIDVWNQEVGQDYVNEAYELGGLIENSLMLIKPENFEITLSQIFNDFEGQYKRNIRASFSYKGIEYSNISITDPATRKMLKNQYPHEGGEPITTKLRAGDNCFLCMSLGPRYTEYNRHYKLVATVFDFDGYIQGTYS